LLGPMRLVAGGGTGLGDAVGSPAWRVFLGLGYSFEQTRDKDSDGILDDQDKCPDRAEDPDGFDDSDGCPDIDNDGDGVPDDRDNCIGVREDLDGYQDDDGCPEDDNDGDGIKDDVDACDDRAEDKDGFKDDDGCPEDDNDGDGIVDAHDKCPLVSENRNGYQDDDGCEDVMPTYVFRQGEKIVFHNILFQTNKWDLLPESTPVLDEIAKSLRDQPRVRVRIEGHTDDVGKPKENLILSQQRALAVVNYLVTKGIDNRRLEYTGYGDTRPEVDVKATKDKPAREAARSKNRRVEFVTLPEIPEAPSGG
jgi:outer membrane protein OmpA-like peptidoglycan-associated protein